MPGSQACPTCGVQLDPMHAPVARIRGGKVVSFCSQDCAAAAPSDALQRRPRSAMPVLSRQTPDPPDLLAAALTPVGAAEPPSRPAPRSTPPPPPMAEPLPPSASQLRRSNRMEASREYLDVESEDEPRLALERGRWRGLLLAVCALVLAGGVALLVRELMPLTGVGDTELGEAESPVREGAGTAAFS